jgi:hypothetical protein
MLRQLERRRNCETRRNWMELLFSFRSSDLTDEVRKKTIQIDKSQPYISGYTYFNF